MLLQNKLPSEFFEKQNIWLYRGNMYRLLVDPCDIANHYGLKSMSGVDHYLAGNRPGRWATPHFQQTIPGCYDVLTLACALWFIQQNRKCHAWANSFLKYHHKVFSAQSSAAAIFVFATPPFAHVWTTIRAIRVCLPPNITTLMPANYDNHTQYNNHTHAWPKAGLWGYLIQAVCSHFGSLRPSSGQNRTCPLLGRACCAWGTHLGSEVMSIELQCKT